MCFYEGFLALRFLLWLPTPTARVVGGGGGGVVGGEAEGKILLEGCYSVIE